jgi:hypothetical protein
MAICQNNTATQWQPTTWSLYSHKQNSLALRGATQETAAAALSQVAELQVKTAAAGGHIWVFIGLDGVCRLRCGPAAD